MLNNAGSTVGLEVIMAESPQKPITIVEIGLSKLKDINDTQGHIIGDELIDLASIILKKISPGYGARI